MKTYNKSYLPETVIYKGVVYERNNSISAAMSANNTPISTIRKTLKAEGRKMVLVNVLQRSLRGKTDLHGNPYQPTKWIFTTSIATSGEPETFHQMNYLFPNNY